MSATIILRLNQWFYFHFLCENSTFAFFKQPGFHWMTLREIVASRFNFERYLPWTAEEVFSSCHAWGNSVSRMGCEGGFLWGRWRSFSSRNLEAPRKCSEDRWKLEVNPFLYAARIFWWFFPRVFSGSHTPGAFECVLACAGQTDFHSMSWDILWCLAIRSKQCQWHIGDGKWFLIP